MYVTVYVNEGTAKGITSTALFFDTPFSADRKWFDEKIEVHTSCSVDILYSHQTQNEKHTLDITEWTDTAYGYITEHTTCDNSCSTSCSVDEYNINLVNNIESNEPIQPSEMIDSCQCSGGMFFLEAVYVETSASDATYNLRAQSPKTKLDKPLITNNSTGNSSLTSIQVSNGDIVRFEFSEKITMLEVFISLTGPNIDNIKEQMISIHTSCSENIMGHHPTVNMGELIIFFWRDRKDMSCCWEEDKNQDLECTPPGEFIQPIIT
eukprot:15344911-Ditylum_brightwellii.AAC.1